MGVGPDALTVTGTYTVRLTLDDNTATGTATLWVSKTAAGPGHGQ